jgi:oligopeptide/dipeptide ABC transporter ATP-binding protein
MLSQQAEAMDLHRASVASSAPTLEVRNLRTQIATRLGTITAVDGVSFTVSKGEVLGLAGESGSGKSLTAYSIMRLLPNRATVTADRLHFMGQDLLAHTPAQMRALRGNRIAMIFQDPMTSLNPVYTVGNQISEVLIQHKGLSRRSARAEAIRLMDAVGLPSAASRHDAYPHEFSGGMRQRIVIAMALACSPDLLIADEPTTALDVTVERQILALLRQLQQDVGAAVLLITHNLALMEEFCDRTAVLYAGQVVEMAPTHEIFAEPKHPYSKGLMSSVPHGPIARERLEPLVGSPPVLLVQREGCSFAPRCPARMARCIAQPEIFNLSRAREVRCFLHENAS